VAHHFVAPLKEVLLHLDPSSCATLLQMVRTTALDHVQSKVPASPTARRSIAHLDMTVPSFRR
jgi:hypothetical protein